MLACYHSWIKIGASSDAKQSNSIAGGCDVAPEGGGAKSINFQALSSDLAQITFDYPFRIPPYFALIIRAIGVLEGIALTTNPEFALVDEAYPYISKRLLTDDSPRLRESLRYMVGFMRGRHMSRVCLNGLPVCDVR